MSPIDATWHSLEQLASADVSIEDLLEAPGRLDRLTVDACNLHLDISKQRMPLKALDLLLKLAAERGVAEHRDAMYRGEVVNVTEDRAVLHTALRAATNHRLADPDTTKAIASELDRVAEFATQIRSGQWRGVTGLPISDVINIGIGGSDLGPRMVTTALREYQADHLKVHFIANVDGAEIQSLITGLNPETTLLVISSKTFTTQETLLNAKTALHWLSDKLGIETPAASPHCIAITASPDSAAAFGVDPARILNFWDFVGGRYSLWSSIGLSIAIAVGFDRYRELLDGAAAMDDHFYTAEPGKNMPMLLALSGIWNHNFLGAESVAVIPYCERLNLLPAFLQQLDMESNGKCTTVDGQAVDTSTGPIVWGQTGTNGQHAFFQLLHQGGRLVPVEFIGCIEDRLSNPEQHRVLIANMLAQAAALMTGEANADRHRNYPGNHPSAVLLMEDLSPAALGSLIALYEHKVFVQGIIWQINSFDQFGVELGKRLASTLLSGDTDNLDPSTRDLLNRTQRGR